MKVLETVITIVYFLSCIGIGVYYRNRAAKSIKGYYNADSSFGFLISALAAYAAFCSGGSILGGAGFAYSAGMAYTWTCTVGSCLGFILAAVYVAPYLREMQITTVSDFFKRRYNWKGITIASGIIVVLAFGAYLISQFKGAALAASYLLGWNYSTALIIVALIYIIYVSIGGMWAVTVTDAVQSVLMLFAMFTLSLTALVKNGGFMASLTKAIETKPNFAVDAFGGVSVIGFCILWMFAACCLPHMVMRMTAAKTTKIAKTNLGLACVLYGLFSTAYIGVAAAAIIHFPPGTDKALPDSDLAFLYTMDLYFGPVVKGFAAAAVMAAIMSTVDSLLLSVSAAFANDIYKEIKPGLEDHKYIIVGQVVIWVVGVLAALLALNPPKLMGILYSNAVGMMTAGFFWPLVLGIWWTKANKYGVIGSFIFGSGAYLVLAALKFFGTITTPLFSEIVYTMPLSLIAFVLISLATNKKEAQEEAYKLMAPVHENTKFI